MFFDKFYVKLYSATRFSYSKLFFRDTNMQYAGQVKTNSNGLLPEGVFLIGITLLQDCLGSNLAV